jgi:hypothetical protein|tara:strand:- start:366 stop:533 length:168 start_codon:yes stop_codon:yes gene_type:complete
MKIFKCALKGMFFTGALTAGAFLTGVTAGLFLNKEKFLKKAKELQFKENKSASSK